jgi:hypothetical protein
MLPLAPRSRCRASEPPIIMMKCNRICTTACTCSTELRAARNTMDERVANADRHRHSRVDRLRCAVRRPVRRDCGCTGQRVDACRQEHRQQAEPIRARSAMMPDGLTEEGFGGGHFALPPEDEVHCLAGPIHRTVRMDPLATNFQISLVDRDCRADASQHTEW